MTKNLMEISEGLTKYFFPRNALVTQKTVMMPMMQKHRGLKLKCSTTRIQELNNLLFLLPGSNESKNTIQEYINEILLHEVPYGWTKQEMMPGFDLDSDSFHDKIELLYHIEVEGDIYEGDGSTYHTKHPSKDDNQSIGRNIKGEAST